MTTYTNTGANRLVGIVSGVTTTLASGDSIDLDLTGIALGATGGTGFVIRIPDETAIAFDLLQGSSSYMRVNTVSSGGGTSITFGGGTTSNPDFIFNGSGPITQNAGGGTVTFTGNVDATNGLDVTVGDLSAAAGATISGGQLQLNDNIPLQIGTSDDLVLSTDGTNSTITSNTGYLLIDNTNATGATHIDLGTDTSATQFDVRNNTGTVLLSVNGVGEVSITNPMKMPQSATPSPAPTNAGFIYVKDVSGQAELFYLGDTGSEAQLTSGGKATPLSRIGASTYVSAQDLQTLFHSAGSVDGGAITASGTNFDVAGGKGLIRITDSKIAELQWFDWAAVTGIAIADGATRYVGVEYNAGSPQVYSSTDPFTNTTTWNLNTRFQLGVVTREGSTLHITMSPQAVGDHANFMIQREYFTMPYERDDRSGGLMLGETGTRYVTLTGGSMWDRLNKYTIAAIDTSVSGGFDTYHRDGDGGFTKAAAQTQWPNTFFSPNNQITGTVAGTATFTTLTGTGTAFTTELKVGDTIILDPGGVNEETRIINTITDNDTLDVTVALTNTHTTSTVRRILAVMTTSYYASLWFYLESEGGLVMVYGEGEFTTSALAASDDTEPGLKPARLNHDQARIVGRFIFQKSASTVTTMLSAWESMGGGGGGGGVTDHGNLSGLGDDDHLQYLLTNGGRLMTGTLQLNTNAITGVTAITAGTAAFPVAADPASVASQGKVYTKVASGITELFYRDDQTVPAGKITQITADGKLNAAALTFGLQEAYNDGNTITTAPDVGPFARNLTVNGTEDFIVGGSVDVTFSTSGAINQSGPGQVTFTGNVDANGGIDVLTAGNFTHAGTGTGTVSRAWTWDTVGQTVTLNDGVELRFGEGSGGDVRLYWANSDAWFVVNTQGSPSFILGNVVVSADTAATPLALAGTANDISGLRSVVKSAVTNLPTYAIQGYYDNTGGTAITNAAAVNAAVHGWVKPSATDTDGSYTSFLAKASVTGGAVTTLRGVYVGPNFDMGLQVDSGEIDLNPTAAFTLDMTGTYTAKISVAANTATAFQVKQGSDNYLDVTTTNSSETVIIGNSMTKPDLNAVIGSSAITLGDTAGVESLAIKNSSAATKFSVNSLGDVVVKGNLTVEGTTVSVNSEEVNIADNHLYLNADYTAALAQTGGIVVNYLPIATSTTTAGAFVAGTTALTPIAGTVSGLSGQTQLTGVATAFLTELQVGWTIVIEPGGVAESKVIASITSDTVLDVVGNLANTFSADTVNRSAANPKVTTTGSGTFVAAQFIQVSGADNPANDGLYEVLSHTGTNLVIKGIGSTACVEDFTENQFTYSAVTGATITRVTVSALRAGVDGVWEMASGAVTGFTFVNLTTAATGTLQAAYMAGNTITLAEAPTGNGPLTIVVDNTAPENNMTVRDGAGYTYFETDCGTGLNQPQTLLGENTGGGSPTNVVGVRSEGAFTAVLGATVSGGAFTFNGTSGSWQMVQATSALTQTGTGQVTFLGNVDAGAGVDVVGRVTIDGSADAVQLEIKGHSTQTSNVILVEQDGGTDIMTLSNAGNLFAAGTITSGLSIVIDGTAATRTITSDAALTVSSTSGNLLLRSLTAGAVNISSVGAADVQAAGAVTINSTGGTIGIGTVADAFAINIGTGAAARTITVGNTTGASALNLTSGTGAMTFTTTTSGIFDVNSAGSVFLDSSAGSIAIGAAAHTGTIDIGTAGSGRVISVGNSTGTTALVLQSGSGNINIGTSSTSRAINVGTGAGGSVQTVTVGSLANGSSTTIQTGTGVLNLGNTATDHETQLGSPTGVSALSVKAGSSGMIFDTSSAGIFDVNATGAVTIDGPGISIDGTLNSNLTVTGAALTVSTATSGALTLTSAAAATWRTSGGALTVDSAAALNLGTTNATSLSVAKTAVITDILGPVQAEEGLWLPGNQKVKYGDTSSAAAKFTSYFNSSFVGVPTFVFAEDIAGVGGTFAASNAQMFIGGFSGDYTLPLLGGGASDNAVMVLARSSNVAGSANHSVYRGEFKNTLGRARASGSTTSGFNFEMTPKTTVLVATGTNAAINNTVTLTGTGTTFLSTLAVGDTIVFDPSGTPQTRSIVTITSDTVLTVSAVWTGGPLTGALQRVGDNAAAIYYGVKLDMQNTTGVRTGIEIGSNWGVGINLQSGGITMQGLDIGTSASEIGNIYIADSKGVRFNSSTVVPTTFFGSGWVYTKEVSSVTELFYKNGGGTEVQLTSGSTLNVSVTLDQAYNGGSSITVDAGAVTLTSTTHTLLDLNLSTVTGTPAMTVDLTGAATNNSGLTVVYGAGSIDSATDVRAISLSGQQNALAGDSVGVYASGFDYALHAPQGVPIALGTSKEFQLQFDASYAKVTTNTANLLLENTAGTNQGVILKSAITGFMGVRHELTTAAVTGDVVYVSAANTLAAADASGIATAQVAGIIVKKEISGEVTLALPGSLCTVTGGYVSGDIGKVVYLSETPGSATVVAPSASGAVVFKLGILVDDSPSRILYMPQFITVLP